eukprot:3771934-Rhodomonas_salina.1
MVVVAVLLCQPGQSLPAPGLRQILAAPTLLVFNALLHAARQLLLRVTCSPTLELLPQCRRLQL